MTEETDAERVARLLTPDSDDSDDSGSGYTPDVNKHSAGKWDRSLHPNVQRKIRRQKEVLKRVRRGSTITQACKDIGISKRSYDGWRRKEPAFRRQIDELRQTMLEQQIDSGPPEDYDGTFESFRRIFMNMETYDHQKQLVKILDDAKPMSVTLVTFPPEHGKTTTLEDFINWKLGENPDFRFGIVSERVDHGTKMIGRVQKRMTDSQFSDYQRQFGPFDPSEMQLDLPWRSDRFIVARRTTDERDYSVIATGWSTAVSGSRYDRLLVDDVQSVKSMNQTKNIAHSLRQDHMTRVGKNGAIVIVATRVGEEDVYDLLLREGVVDEHIRFPAVRPMASPTCEDCDGRGVWGDPKLDPDMPDAVRERGGWTCDCRVLCPQMWDGRSLDQRRKQVGEQIWFTTYQQSPAAAKRSTFSGDMIDRCTSTEVIVGDLRLPSETGLQRRVLIGLDPALDGGNALTALAVSNDDAIVVDVDVDYGLAQWERIFAKIEVWAARYRPHELIVETMAFQKGLANDDRLQTMSRRYGFSIISHETRANKTDPSIGVAAMDRSFLRGEIILPYGNDDSIATLKPLVDQLRKWRPGVSPKVLTQDAVMSLWFPWKRWMETRVSMSHQNGPSAGYRRAGVPYGQPASPLRAGAMGRPVGRVTTTRSR